MTNIGENSAICFSPLIPNAKYMSRFFNGLYTMLYVWCDFKAQNLIINTDPFSIIFLERGQINLKN